MFKYYYDLFIQRCVGGETLSSDTDGIVMRYPNYASDVAFSYQNMRQVLTGEEPYDSIQCNGYEAYKVGEAYIYFEIMSQQAIPMNQSMGALSNAKANTGWKFHILLDDTLDDGNLERGWLIVKNMLMQHRIVYSKIIRDDQRKTTEADPEQLFKTITVYSFKQQKSAQEWQQFIFDTTSALVAAGIKAAPRPQSDRPIKNSPYFSYRNDARNQMSGDDPYENIDAAVDLSPGCTPRHFCNLR